MELATGVLGSLLTQLTDLLAEEYQLGRRVKHGIRFMNDELSSMYAVLQKFGDKEDDQIDPQVIEWRNKVRELSNNIKDCIDRFILNSSNGDSKANFVCNLTRKMKLNHQMARQIQELKSLVMEQSERAKRYGVHQYLAASPHPRALVNPRTPALIAEARDLVGIDGPREEIIQQSESVREKKHTVEGSVIGKLSATLTKEYHLPRVLKGDIRFLMDELSSMYVVLRKLEDKEDDQIDPQALDWRNKVRELSYNIEVRIDRFILRHSHGGSNANFVHKIVRKVKMLQDRHTTVVEIRKLKDLVIEQSERANRYGIYQSLAVLRQQMLNDRQIMDEIIGADMGAFLPKPSNAVQQGTLTVSGMQGSESITDNFSEKQRIGVGGCGEVYKGILRNGVVVAVKRLFKIRTIKDKMFHQEVKSLITVRHPNIVRFLGYCSFTEERVMLFGGTIMVDIRERLLCFEHISNGSLESHLTDELRGHQWNTRYEIIVGICKGLLYLHKEKDIIHMDLKPANILLDDQLVPKITDFGLSRLDNNSQTATTSRLMTPVYCAPEYHSEGKSSSKSDIYSLGVIITEVVTGSKKMPDITKVLRRWRHRWIKSPNHTPLSYQQVTKCLELAQKCTQHDPKGRPDILHIIDELNQIRDSMEDQFQVIPGLEDMLGIDPLEMHFAFEEHDQQISHVIELTNDTEDYFAFITKTSLHRLRTEPEKGIVPPRSKCSVTVTMMQAQVNVAQINRYKEEITVWSTRVDGGLAAKDIKGDMFIDEEGKVVDEVNVIVVLEKPSLADES